MSHGTEQVKQEAVNPWNALSFAPGTVHAWTLGPLDVTIQRTDFEWHLTTSRLSGRTRNEPKTETRRWAAQPRDDTIHFEALLPDRPLVVRPETPLSMQPGREATFFVRIPVWIRVRTDLVPEAILCELPTVILSNSWFGSTVEGELCYALHSTAKRDYRDVAAEPHLAICSLTVRNGSQTVLHVERFCLRTQDLPVSQGLDRLWTVPARVTYRGEGEWSRIVYGQRPPDIAGKTRPIGEPRKKPVRGLVAKTFYALRTLGDEE